MTDEKATPLTPYDVGEMMGRAEAAQFSSNPAVFTAAANNLLRLAPSWLELHKEALAQREEMETLRTENVRLRAALANSELPCVYCTLTAAEMAKCPSGFPGCGRADDAMGCPELGARLEAERLTAENTKLLEIAEQLRDSVYSKSGCLLICNACGCYTSIADGKDVEHGEGCPVRRLVERNGSNIG